MKAGSIPISITVLLTLSMQSAALAEASDTHRTAAPAKSSPSRSVLPSVRYPNGDDREHTRALLENALQYFTPGNGTIDEASGYPTEGWNKDHMGLNLRGFTQLTSIGEWLELLAEIAAGEVETPVLSRDQAFTALEKVVQTLRRDQHDPLIAANGLLVNFIKIQGNERQSFPTLDVEKKAFEKAFDPVKARSVWRALASAGLIEKISNGRAKVQQDAIFDAAFSGGPLSKHSPDKETIRKILKQPAVMTVYGDNANLSTSVAKAIGALLRPGVRDDSRSRAVRAQLESFLEEQKKGYASLLDPKAGLFYFGTNATRNQLIGTETGGQAGHQDYLINEFRGPTSFVVTRFGLPIEPVKNLGFQLKPYRAADGRELYALVPYDGSAFEALGLGGLSMEEMKDPSWRLLLKNMVEIETDYSRKHRLAGFLSESYTGNGVDYNGEVGIPEMAINTNHRITNTPSLYTMGPASNIAPDVMEKFLKEKWPAISKLRTEHGPWEGVNHGKQLPVEVQTSAHTLSLILGIVGTGSDNMRRYLDAKKLTPQLAKIYPQGQAFDWLSRGVHKDAWPGPRGGEIVATFSGRDRDTRTEHWQISTKGARQIRAELMAPQPQGINLSRGFLTLKYESSQPLNDVSLTLVPAGQDPAESSLLPKEILVNLSKTEGKEREIKVPLPATPGLTDIKSIRLQANLHDGQPVQLSLIGLKFEPWPADSDIGSNGGRPVQLSLTGPKF